MKVKRNYKYLALALSLAITVLLIIGIVAFLKSQFPLPLNMDLVDVEKKITQSSISYIDVTRYIINLDLDTRKEIITGDVSIKLRTKNENQKKIILDFYDNFNITSVYINGIKTDFEYEDNSLIVPNKFPNTDELDIRVLYNGTPENVGLGSFNFGEYKNKSLVYSLSEPVFASTWFPCNDDVTDKAYLEMNITNDSNMVSISNGKLTGITVTGGKKTYSYKSDYLISTYLIALYSGQYETFLQDYISLDSSDTMAIHYYVTEDKLEEAEIDFSIHPEAIKILSELFGEYPFIRDGYGVAQFLWQNGAMEHQTITGIGSNFISGHKFHTSMLVHELAHHWWGNAVSPKSWKDIWLNEGFATYSEALYYEKRSGIEALQSTMTGLKNNFNKGKLYNPGLKMFSRLVYDKGAWVLHMLRRQLGDEIFFRVLRNYYKRFKYNNANTNDFKNICEQISGVNLKKFFDQWVYSGIGIIDLDYSWESKNDSVKLLINQIQDSDIIYNFPLDIEIMYSETDNDTLRFSISKKEERICFPVRQKIIDIKMDPENWLLASFNRINKEK